MIIFCRLCHQMIRSLQPDQAAQAEVLQQMGQHLGTAHQEEATALGTILGSFSAYLLMHGYVDIPQSESALRESFKLNESLLFDWLEDIRDRKPVEPVQQEIKKGPNGKSGPMFAEN